MSSIKGKADLWRTGKDGAGPGKRASIPGGGEDFAKKADFKSQYKGDHKVGGGGMNSPSSTDNKGVFANSIAGLAIKDGPFLKSPGSGRSGLDMYAIGSSQSEDSFGLDMGKAPKKKHKGF